MSGEKVLQLGWEHLEPEAERIAREIVATIKLQPDRPRIWVYGIPNGGIPAATMVACLSPRLLLTEFATAADVFVDDIVDSGKTRDLFRSRFPEVPFFALIDKTGKDSHLHGTWVSFPWERMQKSDGPQDNIRRILQFIGEDPDREGLKETPDRVVKSYAELFGGMKQDPAEVFKTFDGEKYDEVVLLGDIDFESTCEHHMLPFIGRAHVAYIPDGPIIGASKAARLVDVFAKRLQVQERMTQQIAGAMQMHLSPKGVAVVVKASHLCMTCRGVRKPNSTMTTSCMLGAFRDKPEARAELMSLLRNL